MDTKKNKESEKSKEKEIYNAILKDLNVIIKDQNCRKLYEKGYYGNLDNDTLYLDPNEALLLLERKRLIIKDENGKEYDFKTLTEYFVNKIPNFWVKYLVYKDLRNRGYIVKQGFGDEIEFRVYERGATAGETNAKYLVHPVVEGSPLKLTELSKITKIAKSARKSLILVVVDRQGEVTYYKCKEVVF